jgi:hypothetical protein
MRNIFLVFLIILYVNLESVHVQFSKNRYSKNFFAPVAKAINNCLPSFYQITVVNQDEDIWWYAHDLIENIKAFLLGIIAIFAYTAKENSIWIKLIFTTLLVFLGIEIYQYIVFKNIFNMEYDNYVCDGAIVLLFIIHIYKDEPGRTEANN